MDSTTVRPSPGNGFIYKATNLLNGKIYIGQTKSSIAHRKAQHNWRANKKYSTCAFTLALAKYGWQGFRLQVIEECAIELLNEREMFWISALNTRCPSGYNLTPGGNQYEASAETRRKISEAHKGKIIPEWHREAVSKANKGRPLSDEHKAKIGAYWKGRSRGPEWAQLMSEKFKGRPCPTKGKARVNPDAQSKVYRVTSPLGDVIIIRNLSRFCREHNLHLGHMCGLATGSRKAKRHKGWTCEHFNRDTE